jgi:glutamine synthetase
MGHSKDVPHYPDQITQMKHLLTQNFPDINFSPKPFKDDYGSAMHFHVNFLTKDNSEFFEDDTKLNLAASGLCHYMLHTFLIFAPEENYYDRFSANMAPSHVSFGPNNRSVAVRIPDSRPRRLEHRISAPSTDPYIAIYAILNSIYNALKNPDEITNYTKIYGNAFDKQYDLKPLPMSLSEAKKLFDKSFFI